MHTVRVASSSPLLQRTCLCCGYRGEELQRSGERAAYKCPGCGQDLYARPPRSYAEMEGLHVQLLPAARPPVGSNQAPRRAEGRTSTWLGRLLRKVLARLGLLEARTGRTPTMNTQVRHRPATPRR